MKIEKEIGNPESKGFVYVYYNVNDKLLATHEKRDRWECKIGYSQANPIYRIIEQGVNTCWSHEPIIGLLIHTDTPILDESRIHRKLSTLRIVEGINDEWFMTNPKEVEDVWYDCVIDKPFHEDQVSQYRVVDEEDLSSILKQQRKIKKLTQETLVEDICSRFTYARMETKADYNMHISTMFKILKRLNLRIYLEEDLG